MQGDGEINALFSGIKGAQTPPPWRGLNYAVRTNNRFSNLTIESDVAHCVSESSQDSDFDKNISSERSTQYNGQTNDSDQTSPSHSNERVSFNSISDLSSEIEYKLNSDLTLNLKVFISVF